ncbi:hypothetical protein mvi_47800 [Methylobacterium indicum]|uniref:Uncharacterized protein n=1 Tax=Methylobacterium indicum TaxID=1775910 RepID=A0A8H8WY62_9HYPH|nr:hypothetical protein mvi_47800 [Methylobacterium indicum]
MPLGLLSDLADLWLRRLEAQATATARNRRTYRTRPDETGRDRTTQIDPSPF